MCYDFGFLSNIDIVVVLVGINLEKCMEVGMFFSIELYYFDGGLEGLIVIFVSFGWNSLIVEIYR